MPAPKFKSLEEHWENMVKSLSAFEPEPQSFIREKMPLWKAVASSYGLDSAPFRTYHNLNHLAFMFHHLDLLKHKHGLAKLFDYSDSKPIYSLDFEYQFLKLAIFYHDVVYNVGCDSNELNSANLLSQSFPSPYADYPASMILATRYHDPSSNPTQQLLLDLDLLVFSGPWDEYVIRQQSVVKEFLYENFSEDSLVKGRTEFLEHLLMRSVIYGNQKVNRLYEVEARVNISKELGVLKSGKLL